MGEQRPAGSSRNSQPPPPPVPQPPPWLPYARWPRRRCQRGASTLAVPAGGCNSPCRCGMNSAGRRGKNAGGRESGIAVTYGGMSVRGHLPVRVLRGPSGRFLDASVCLVWQGATWLTWIHMDTVGGSRPLEPASRWSVTVGGSRSRKRGTGPSKWRYGSIYRNPFARPVGHGSPVRTPFAHLHGWALVAGPAKKKWANGLGDGSGKDGSPPTRSLLKARAHTVLPHRRAFQFHAARGGSPLPRPCGAPLQMTHRFAVYVRLLPPRPRRGPPDLLGGVWVQMTHRGGGGDPVPHPQPRPHTNGASPGQP